MNIDYMSFIEDQVSNIRELQDFTIGKPEVVLKDTRVCGFISPRQSGKTRFIEDWVDKYPKSFIIPRDMDSRVVKTHPDKYSPYLFVTAPRSFTSCDVGPIDDIEYLLIEDGNEAFNFGRIKKKEFYKWVVDTFGMVIVILAN